MHKNQTFGVCLNRETPLETSGNIKTKPIGWKVPPIEIQTHTEHHLELASTMFIDSSHGSGGLRLGSHYAYMTVVKKPSTTSIRPFFPLKNCQDWPSVSSFLVPSRALEMVESSGQTWAVSVAPQWGGAVWGSRSEAFEESKDESSATHFERATMEVQVTTMQFEEWLGLIGKTWYRY